MSKVRATTVVSLRLVLSVNSEGNVIQCARGQQSVAQKHNPAACSVELPCGPLTTLADGITNRCGHQAIARSLPRQQSLDSRFAIPNTMVGIRFASQTS